MSTEFKNLTRHFNYLLAGVNCDRAHCSEKGCAYPSCAEHKVQCSSEELAKYIEERLKLADEYERKPKPIKLTELQMTFLMADRKFVK